MPLPRHLRNAPITEAIIDVRVNPRQEFQPEAFESLEAGLKARFPQVERRKAGQVTFHLVPAGARPPEVKDLGMQGLFFRSSDGKLIAQCRVDGFSLNRLAPYTSWDELFPIAADLWERYRLVADPELVMRLAVRYINHITLPPELADFERYLRAAPPIPAELPQYVSAFLTRCTINNPEIDSAAHVTQVFSQSGPSDAFGLIFDIDAYSDVSLSPSDPIILDRLTKLRAFKNQIFFSYLTDELLERFE